MSKRGEGGRYNVRRFHQFGVGRVKYRDLRRYQGNKRIYGDIKLTDCEILGIAYIYHRDGR